MKFSGKVAVVTGAAKGIGKAVAVLFAENGVRVVVADIDAAEGARTASEIRSAGGEALFLRCDVSCVAGGGRSHNDGDGDPDIWHCGHSRKRCSTPAQQGSAGDHGGRVPAGDEYKCYGGRSSAHGKLPDA